MDEAVLRFRVGIFVLLAFIILGVLIFLHVEGFQSQYSIFVKPNSAPGVTKNTPVRKNGLLIGRVASVQTEDDLVNVHLRINSNEEIFENELVSFGTASFLGDAVIEILPKTKNERGNLVGDEHLMAKWLVKPNPLEVVEEALDLAPQIADTLAVFQEAGDSVKSAGDNISSLSEIVENALNDDESDFKMLINDVRKLSQRADGALENFQLVFDNLNNIVGDPELKGKVNEMIDNLPKFVEELQMTITDTRETINSFRNTSKLADENLANLAPFTESLKTEGPAIVKRINESLANVDKMMEEVATFTDSIAKIGESEGSLGKFINDSEVYDSVLATAENIRKVSEKLEPVINDIRTLADSLARDPRQLGLRGAADFRPLQTGYKASTTGRDRVKRQ